MSRLTANLQLKCAECDNQLALVSTQNFPMAMNPDYVYYYRNCGCNPYDKRIIRVPKTNIGFETVGTATDIRTKREKND